MKLYFKINLTTSLLYYQTRKKIGWDCPQTADCADPLRMADAWLLQRSDARCSFGSHTDDSSPQRSACRLSGCSTTGSQNRRVLRQNSISRLDVRLSFDGTMVAKLCILILPRARSVAVEAALRSGTAW